ncbi:MAG TPA: hypothetical protein VEM76_02925 [Anaeromyxobacteraceae bacterium]|nr:hypothetical protein [Anaeromyxobacteraceae bacterium]
MPGQPSARPIVPPPLPLRGGAAAPVSTASVTPIPVAARTPASPAPVAVPTPTLTAAPIPTLTAAKVPTLAPAAPSLPAVAPAPAGGLDPFAPFALTPVPLGPILERAQECVWPAAVAPAAAAEALLAGTLRGARVSGTATEVAVAARVARVLSPDERAALTGGPVAHDPSMLRAAAALRLRLQLALATVPAAGAPFDGAAAQALLGEVDAALAQVKAAAAAAEPPLAASLDPIRLALVDGGVELAGAHARLTPEGVVAPVAPSSAPASRAATRVISNEDARQTEAAPVAGKGTWFAFGAAVLLAVAYHGYQLATREPHEPLASLPGAPAQTYLVNQGASHVLRAYAGARVDPGELEKFRVQELARGNVLRELGAGIWIIEPASTGGGKLP